MDCEAAFGVIQAWDVTPANLGQMADFGLDGLSSDASPDRLDALVWAVTELAERAASPGPRIRSLWDGPLTPRGR